MSAALTPIERLLLTGDADAGGHKILNLDTSNLGEFNDQAPFADNLPLIKGSADASKLARFEVDGFTTGQTRVFTLPNYNAQLATLAGTEAFTNKTSFNGLTLSGSGGGINLDSGIISLSNSTLVLDGDVTLGGSSASLTLLYGINTTLTLPSSGTVATTNQIPTISDAAYNEATWNGNLDGASKNAIRDKIETMTAASSQPFSDATALIKGSGNSLKQFRIEVDGLSTGIRVMTPPDYDFTPASIAGAELIINKSVNGLTLNVGTAASTVAAPVYGMSPGTPSNLNLVAVSPQTSTTGVFRTTAPFDVVVPVSGTLATVAGTIPFAYLSVNKDLGGGLASDVKVSTQLAIKTYVDAHSGAGKEAVSGDTVASTTSVDLSATTDYQLDVSGTEDIEQFIIDEDDERVVVFEDALTLIHSATLQLPGSFDIPIAAGDYGVVRGQADGVTTVLRVQKASFAPNAKVADFDGGSTHRLTEFGISSGGLADGFELLFQRQSVSPFSNDRTLQIGMADEDRLIYLGGDVQFAGAFSTLGPVNFLGTFTTQFTATANVDATLPVGATLLAGIVTSPASAGAVGVTAQFAFDASFLYVCTATNTWRRIAHATW